MTKYYVSTKTTFILFFYTDSQNVIGSSSTERALLKHAIKRGYGNLGEHYERLSEVPFSSERKFMSVQCRNRSNPSGGVALQYVKGAAEEILPRCRQYLARGRLHLFDQKYHYFSVETAAKNMASRGLRVVAFARGRTLVDLEFIGLVGMLYIIIFYAENLTRKVDMQSFSRKNISTFQVKMSVCT